MSPFSVPAAAPAAARDVRVFLSLNALALLAVLPWIGTIVELCSRAILAIS